MPGMGQHWPEVMGRFIFLGSLELSRAAYKALACDLDKLEQAVILEYLKLPIPLELRKFLYETSFPDQVEARGRVLDKLKRFFQV